MVLVASYTWPDNDSSMLKQGKNFKLKAQTDHSGANVNIFLKKNIAVLSKSKN